MIEESTGNPLANVDSGLRNEDNGTWRQEIQPLQQAQLRQRPNRANAEAKEVRNKLKLFYNAEGAVGWQNQMI